MNNESRETPPITTAILNHQLFNSVLLVTIVSGVFVLLGWFTLPVRLVLLAVITWLAIRALSRKVWGSDLPWSRSCVLRFTSYVFALVAAAILLWASGTTDPIRSPWSVVPAPFFFLYALLAFAFVVRTGDAEDGSPTVASVLLFLASAVAILVYPLGFGFDHFIHVAAERIILTDGGLTPPPLFYSGYYGLVGLLATVPGMSAALADRLLVPLVVAFGVVPFVWRSFRAHLPKYHATIATSSLLIVPFLPLAVSTPQALANAFGLVAIIALATRGVTTTSVLAAAAALLAQPLTGIPVAATIAAVWFITRRRLAIGIIVATLGAIAITIAFAVAQVITPQLDIKTSFAIGLLFTRLVDTAMRAVALVATDFSHADALSVARALITLLWIALAFTGARVLRRERHPLAPYLLGPLIAAGASALVAMTTTTASQLAEEQSQFPLRLLALAALLAMPLVGIALASITKCLRNYRTRAAYALTFSVLATMTLTLAYPRDDAQARSGLWSVSADDIAAVHAIAEDASDRRYVVLANQMLGAAAIQKLGFRPSTITDRGEALSFPLPAGGPIAQQFWAYIGSQPLTREPADTAMRLVNADRAYLVLHDYWRSYNRLVVETERIADSELAPLPHLRIFRFDAQD